jgi:hypothetical protein
MEKLVHSRDTEELCGAVAVKQRKGQSLLFAKLLQQRPSEPPPPPPILPTGPIP